MMSLLSSYLMHHGIKGQKWGVRNGPPYPLNKPSAESQHQAVLNLSKELNTEWEYGVIHNGKRINTEMEDFDWSQYRTIPVDILRKEKIGTCWDYVNYESKVLNNAGIKNKAYLLMMDLRSDKDPDRIVTHTFSTFTLNGKNYWLESAMWSKRGVHEISDVSEIAKDVANVYSDKRLMLCTNITQKEWTMDSLENSSFKGRQRKRFLNRSEVDSTEVTNVLHLLQS